MNKLNWLLLAMLVVTAVIFSACGPAATSAPTEKATQAATGKQNLDKVISSLKALDTAYASGNMGEAQTRFNEAKSAWDQVASLISVREAREAQLLFDSLNSKLQAERLPL